MIEYVDEKSATSSLGRSARYTGDGGTRMRYIPAITLWILADLGLCILAAVLVAGIAATKSVGALDAHDNGYRVGQAAVVGIQRYWLYVPR